MLRFKIVNIAIVTSLTGTDQWVASLLRPKQDTRRHKIRGNSIVKHSTSCCFSEVISVKHLIHFVYLTEFTDRYLDFHDSGKELLTGYPITARLCVKYALFGIARTEQQCPMSIWVKKSQRLIWSSIYH